MAAVPLLVFPLYGAEACGGVGEEQYSTLNGVENGGQALRALGPDLANEVVTPPGCDITLVGVVLEVKLQRRDLGSFDILYSPINKVKQPYRVQVFATVPDSTLTRDFTRVFVQPNPGTVLKSNQRYYVGIRKHVGALSTVILGNTVDPTILRKKAVVAGGYFYNIKGQQPIVNGPYEMHIILSN